jgi:hypothetical protein
VAAGFRDGGHVHGQVRAMEEAIVRLTGN